MRNIVINTSDLGYITKSFRVTTDCTNKKLKELDEEYGMKYRTQSTTIENLANGAEEEGYEFEYKEVPFTRGWDYFARCGNY